MHSLLWPSGRPPASDLFRLGSDAIRDLEIEFLAEAIATERPDRRHAVMDVLTAVPLDAEIVVWRTGAVSDLLGSSALCDALQEAVRGLRLLTAHRPQAFAREVPRAARIGARVVELEAYVEVLRLLGKALDAPSLRSRALLALRDDVGVAAGSPEFRALSEELPRWRHTLDDVRGITIAVNVSPGMEPEAAVITGFSSTPAVVGDAALSRLLGTEVGPRGLVRLFRRQPVDWQAGDSRLVADVQALLEAVAAPVERALTSFRLINAQAVAHLEDELVVLLGAARLARTWRARGMPCCVAELVSTASADVDLAAGASAGRTGAPRSAQPGGPVPGTPRGADESADGTSPPTVHGAGSLTDGEADHVEDAFLPTLLARMPSTQQMVGNRVDFGPDGRVWILTGPNRGGKTTYLRTVGVTQVLGQCGLPVPARRACLHLVDGIFTHFPELEAGVPGHGRLDEEAARLAEIFATCSPHGLVLLNEVLAGTSAPEGVALATDVLRGLRVLGCRVVYATHLHELAMRCSEINVSVTGRATVASLVAVATPEGVEGGVVRRPTYRVVRGAPEGASYFASSIARQHGISLPQIMEGLRSRGLIGAG